MNQTQSEGRNVLYITYDGLTDQLGRSQVLPYLVGLSALGHRITILSCEKADRYERDRAVIGRICADAGIDWSPIRYHKRPPILSSVWDLRAMTRTAERLHRATPFDLVHCRSYLPAAAGLRLKRRFGVPLLFDMRGFWPDERIEGGSWPQSNPVFRAVYRQVKRLESRLLAGSDHIVSLTQVGADILRRRNDVAPTTPITVIPCCADFDHFALATPEARTAAREQLGIEQDRKVLVYLGSVGAWYMLDEMFDLVAVWLRRQPGGLFLMITQEPAERVRAAAAARGITPDHLLVKSASREEVPHFLSAADIGIFFIKPVPSKQASSPTKMGEMMAIGLPLITNGGVGDVAEIVAESGCGVVIDRFDREGYEQALDQLARVTASPTEIRQAGLRWYDAAEGIERYDRVYQSLLA